MPVYDFLHSSGIMRHSSVRLRTLELYNTPCQCTTSNTRVYNTPCQCTTSYSLYLMPVYDLVQSIPHASVRLRTFYTPCQCTTSNTLVYYTPCQCTTSYSQYPMPVYDFEHSSYLSYSWLDKCLKGAVNERKCHSWNKKTIWNNVNSPFKEAGWNIVLFRCSLQDGGRGPRTTTYGKSSGDLDFLIGNSNPGFQNTPWALQHRYTLKYFSTNFV